MVQGFFILPVFIQPTVAVEFDWDGKWETPLKVEVGIG